MRAWWGRVGVGVVVAGGERIRDEKEWFQEWKNENEMEVWW